MILHLGVADVPYADPGTKKKSGSLTTGDVAEILEAKYGVMGHFVDLHGADIARELENSVLGAIESLIAGAPASHDAFGTATSEIEEIFRAMLSNRELDKLGIPGVPTAAAKRGVSHRFKRPYARRKERPSFIDTGLYQDSFKAWVE
jgi:hypothetical protein